MKKSVSEHETPTQLAVENTQTPLEKNEGVVFDAALENALENMKNKTGF